MTHTIFGDLTPYEMACLILGVGGDILESQYFEMLLGRLAPHLGPDLHSLHDTFHPKAIEKWK